MTKLNVKLAGTLLRDVFNTVHINHAIKQLSFALGNEVPTTNFYKAIRQLVNIVNHVLCENKLPDNVLFAANAERSGVELLYQQLIAVGFEVIWAHAMQKTNQLPDQDEVIRKKKRASKTTYSCPVCKLNAWAKPSADLVCGTCVIKLLEHLV